MPTGLELEYLDRTRSRIYTAVIHFDVHVYVLNDILKCNTTAMTRSNFDRSRASIYSLYACNSRLFIHPSFPHSHMADCNIFALGLEYRIG